MYPFKLEHLNIDELSKAQLESMMQNKFSRIWHFLPQEMIFESIKIFQDFIVFCILRDNTGFNLEALSKLPDNTNGEFFNQDLKRSIFSRLSSGESI
jgi:ubiquinone biosynthesis protein Coq4